MTRLRWLPRGRFLSAAVLGVLMLGGSLEASANSTVNVDAGFLYGSNAAKMPTGSLLLLVASASGTTFSGPSAGSYSGSDTILGASSFNNNVTTGGTNGNGGEGTNAFLLSTTSYPTSLVGHDVALYWFPSITYTSYTTGTLPSSMTIYGAYNPLAIAVTANSTLSPDGGSNWVVPTDGNNNYRLLFVTMADGGTQGETTGYARFAVPEPSTGALLGGAALAFAVAYARRCRRSDTL